MRFISFHVTYFKYKVTKKGRSKIREDLNEQNKEQEIEQALVLMISMEKRDESDSNILEKAVKEISKICEQLKVKNICLIPYAHLFGELSSLEFGFKALKDLETELKNKDFHVIRIPFGWFTEFEMKTKGHPLSRISRIIE
ncbi:MAG: threonyl-tRNA synthetase editing domain-containing protein [Promethearchaeota archaeon]